MYSYLTHTSDIVNNCMLNEAIKFSCVSTGPFGWLSRKDKELTTRTHPVWPALRCLGQREARSRHWVPQCNFPKQKPLSSSWDPPLNPMSKHPSPCSHRACGSPWALFQETIAEKVALGYMDPMSRLYLPWLELGVTFWWSGPWCGPGWNQMSKNVDPLTRLSAQAGSKGATISASICLSHRLSLLRRKLCFNASLFLRVILSSWGCRWT